MPRRIPKIQLLTNSYIPWHILRCKVTLAIRCGVDCVQYRAIPNEQDLYERARFFAELCQNTNTMFIVNDYVHIAAQLNNEGFEAGVWLGQSDMHASTAREILGNNAFIGLSVNSVYETLEANALPVTAVAANGVFECHSNPNAQRMGIHALRDIIHHSEHPTIAIGGIIHDNVIEVLATGVDGIALSGALLQTENVENATTCLIDLCHQFQTQ